MPGLLLIAMMMTMVNYADLGERISRTATISLNSDVDHVFPLFGPIREKEWADGWDPEVIFSDGKLVCDKMIFRTKGRVDAEPFYTWVVTKYEPKTYEIEYTVSTQNRVWFIDVQCERFGEKTKAAISYTYTSLNDEGKKLNHKAMETMFANDLKDWEHAINHYLKTGTILKDH